MMEEYPNFIIQNLLTNKNKLKKKMKRLSRIIQLFIKISRWDQYQYCGGTLGNQVRNATTNIDPLA